MQQQHQSSIESLARSAGVPVSEVANIYRAAFAELAADARIKGFLPIFASRKVRETLRHRSVAAKSAA